MTNYIRVDHHHYEDTSAVYDEDGGVYREFTNDGCGGRMSRRHEANKYAAAMAAELGCEWGSN